MSVPLSILDLSPIAAGSDAGDAIRASLELATAADAWGYRRVWYAEHHLTPGVASTSPAVLAALAAERTRRIRVGSGAVLLAHTSPALAVEQFATIARAHPGRVDLGLGRASVPPPSGAGLPREGGASPREGAAPPHGSGAASPRRAGGGQDRTVDGLLVPAPPAFSLDDPDLRRRLARLGEVTGRRGEIAEYDDELRLALGLLADGVTTADGHRVTSAVAAGSGVELFSLASSGGASAVAAGALGLPLAANYHVNPASVLETVAAYRAAFRPGVLERPYVAVSADVLVADDDATARRLASGFAAWVRSIRAGDGAIPYPAPGEADDGDPADAVVRDRVATRFVGGPDAVVAGLAALVRATGADELLLTTITHDPEHRLASYDLLARAWAASAASSPAAALVAG